MRLGKNRALRTLTYTDLSSGLGNFQVRKLWLDYSEAKGDVASPFGSSTTSAESREGDEYDADARPISSSGVPTSSSVQAGQGPARALRAFVEAVDLADARQAAVLQNLVRSVRLKFWSVCA